MRQICLLLLGACLVLPAYAQDAASAYTDAASSADNASAMTPQSSTDTTTEAPTTGTTDAAPADTGTAAAPPAATDTAPAGSEATDTAPASAGDSAATDTSAPADTGATPDQAASPAAAGNPYADAGSPAASTPIENTDAGAAAAPAAAAGGNPYADAGSPAATSGGNPYADAGSPAATSGGNPYADAGSPAATSGGNPYADAGSPAATSGSISTASEATSSESSSSAEPEETRNPIKLYVGYDRTHINFQISGVTQGPVAGPTPPTTTPQSPLQQQFGSSDLTSNFNQIRAGVRVFNTVGIEAHYGRKGSSGNAPGTVEVKNYEGIFIVPTATVLNTVELAAVLGYNWIQLDRPGASKKLNGIAYGLNLELPLRVLWEKLPNIRLGGGVMVYQSGSRSHIYGTHFGARYDFSL